MEKVLDWIITIIFVVAMIAIGIFIFRGIQNMMNQDNTSASVTSSDKDDYSDEDDYLLDEDDMDLSGDGDGTLADAIDALPKEYDTESMTDDELAAAVAKHSAKTKNSLTGIGSGLSNAVKDGASAVKDGAGNLTDGAIGGAKSLAGTVKDGAGNLKDGAVDGAKSLAGTVKDGAGNLKDGAVDGAKSLAGTVKGAAGGAVDGAKSLADKVTNTKPSVDADGFDFSDDTTTKGTDSKKSTTKTSTTTSAGNYLVLAGVFSTQANADKHMKYLRKMGCDSPESSLFGGAKGKVTVIASRHTTDAGARTSAKALKAKKVDCYVHKKRTK